MLTLSSESLQPKLKLLKVCDGQMVGAGKEPIWQATLTLHYYDETTVIVKAYERDMMSSEFMGEGKVDVKALKDSGALEIKIEGEGEEIGKVTCNYTLKTLPPTPLLTVKNIKCDFYK